MNEIYLLNRLKDDEVISVNSVNLKFVRFKEPV